MYVGVCHAHSRSRNRRCLNRQLLRRKISVPQRLPFTLTTDMVGDVFAVFCVVVSELVECPPQAS